MKLQAEKRQKKDLSSFAEACDRAQVSDRAAALLSTSLLENFGIITKKNAVNVIEKNKFRLARVTVRTALSGSHIFSDINSLYFDGRRDTAYVNEKEAINSTEKKSPKNTFQQSLSQVTQSALNVRLILFR